MADNDAPLARLATLSTLPPEIKARICELAALQDERYKERWVPGAPGEELVKVHKNAWRGKSLAALSETSKEFNELASKHIFHTLTDTQIDSFMFALVVLPKHTSRVRRVNIKRPTLGPAARDVRPVFAALPLLPKLSDLKITHAAVLEVLGDLTQDPVEGQTRMFRDVFRPVARRLRTVALVNFLTVDSVVALLAMGESLQDITVTGPTVAEQRLGEYLSKITTLERLTLDATSAGSAGLHFASGWPTLETLSSLALINIKLEANSVALINQHALTLRHLTLRLPYDSPPTPTPTPGFPLFNKLPILSTITLQNISSDLFESVVAAIAVATTTNSNPAESTVHALTIELKDRGKPLIKSRLRASLAPFVCLRRLDMGGPSGARLSNSLMPIFPPHEPRTTILSTSATKDTFVARDLSAAVKAKLLAAPSVERWRVGGRHEAIKAALAHGDRLADRFLREDDVDGLEILFDCLGDIWGDKLLEDD